MCKRGRPIIEDTRKTKMPYPGFLRTWIGTNVEVILRFQGNIFGIHLKNRTRSNFHTSLISREIRCNVVKVIIVE